MVIGPGRFTALIALESITLSRALLLGQDVFVNGFKPVRRIPTQFPRRGVTPPQLITKSLNKSKRCSLPFPTFILPTSHNPHQRQGRHKTELKILLHSGYCCAYASTIKCLKEAQRCSVIKKGLGLRGSNGFTLRSPK